MKKKYLYIITTLLLLLLIMMSLLPASSLLITKSGFGNTTSAALPYKATIVEKTFDALPDEDGNGIKDVMENLVPGNEVTFDPVIVSKADSEVWAIIKIAVPTVSSTLVNDDGKTVHDIFTFEANPNYTLLESNVSEEEGVSSIYYYGLNNPLAAKSKSVPLCKKIIVNDFAECGEVSDVSVDVDGVIIQVPTVPDVESAFLETGSF